MLAFFIVAVRSREAAMPLFQPAVAKGKPKPVSLHPRGECRTARWRILRECRELIARSEA
jgi:hypothetical protein